MLQLDLDLGGTVRRSQPDGSRGGAPRRSGARLTLVHLAYLLLHFAGEHARVERVVGDLANLGGNPRVGYDHLGTCSSASARCAGLLRVASDVSPPSFRLEVRGTAGSVATLPKQPLPHGAHPARLRHQGALGQLRSATRDRRGGGDQPAGQGARARHVPWPAPDARRGVRRHSPRARSYRSRPRTSWPQRHSPTDSSASPGARHEGPRHRRRRVPRPTRRWTRCALRATRWSPL